MLRGQCHKQTYLHVSCGMFLVLMWSPVEHSFELNSGNIPPAAELQKTFQFQFPTCDKLPPPVLPFDDVAFSYTADMSKAIYKRVNLGVDCDSRIALVGPNGAGKSTLLKMMAGELSASR